MTAMSQGRTLTERQGTFTNGPVKAGATIFIGALVVNDGGVLAPARTALNLTPVGFSEENVVNSGADGAKRVTAKRTTAKMFNLATDAITEADLGKDCYIVDDQTVAKTSGSNTRSVAGKVVGVEADGVFVRIGF